MEIKSALRHIEEVWEAFYMTQTGKELFKGAQTRGGRLMAVREAAHIADNASLKFRNGMCQ
ncbi:MAG: hypothetical protein V2B19_15115 [Pseudomonadota bacterium]